MPAGILKELTNPISTNHGIGILLYTEDQKQGLRQYYVQTRGPGCRNFAGFDETPGGDVESYELEEGIWYAVYNATQRELREELGCPTLELEKNLLNYDYHGYIDEVCHNTQKGIDEKWRNHIVSVQLVGHVEFTIHPSETTKVGNQRWVTLEQLENLQLSGSTVKMLDHLRSGINTILS
jgi:8-oxo-dGTP pyrophosphatase MutT (NUDIX family)